MLEAVNVRPESSSNLIGSADLSVSSERPSGLGIPLNTGRGRVLTTLAADETVVGDSSDQWTFIQAEGGPAVLIEDVVVRDGRRDQDIWSNLSRGAESSCEVLTDSARIFFA